MSLLADKVSGRDGLHHHACQKKAYRENPGLAMIVGMPKGPLYNSSSIRYQGTMLQAESSPLILWRSLKRAPPWVR